MPTSPAHPTAPRTAAAARYVAPGRFTRRVFNPLVARLTGLGLSLKGTRVLEVRGRRSGEVRSTVVNLLRLDGHRFLVAPRGETEWVRNVRVAGEATLRLGRRREAIRPVELRDDEKLPVLRTYLREWGWEVGALVEGLSKDSTDADLEAAAPGFPVFRID